MLALSWIAETALAAFGASVLVLWIARELLSARRVVRLIDALHDVTEALDDLRAVMNGDEVD